MSECVYKGDATAGNRSIDYESISSIILPEVFVVMIHEPDNRPMLQGIYRTEEKAKDVCFNLNNNLSDNKHADYFVQRLE